MHIWHHAKHLPAGSTGINFGITLSVWDYIFGTASIPYDGRDIPLGFEEVDTYPHGFFSQMAQPLKEK
jgi:sterol desaturase/sphingolipid hydroxylase (fatty acid hydroxylase superfamily)